MFAPVTISRQVIILIASFGQIYRKLMVQC